MRVAEFFESLIEGEKTLIHFSAVWCTPCRLMEPSIAEFLGDNPAIRYIKLDVDDVENSEIMNEFAVKSVPTMIAFNGRSKIGTAMGAKTKSELEDMWQG